MLSARWNPSCSHDLTQHAATAPRLGHSGGPGFANRGTRLGRLISHIRYHEFILTHPEAQFSRWDARDLSVAIDSSWPTA